jgi:hypothetical protein
LENEWESQTGRIEVLTGETPFSMLIPDWKYRD